MKIRILGSGREVGRGAVLVENGSRIMLDYGVKLHPEPPQYPVTNLSKKIEGAVITHAHLDHSGASPLLSNVHMNDLTSELAQMLLMDSIKVSRLNGYGTPFEKNDVRKMIKNAKIVNYEDSFDVDNFSCRLYPSGHIPGSSSVLLENGKTVLYTSDISTGFSRLLNSCVLPDSADVLVIESTYSYRDHVPRKEEESRLIRLVEETLAKEEIVLIPAFAVGRSQEILLILEKFAGRIALDGMSKKASQIISSYSHYLKDRRLKKVLEKIHFVKSKKDREQVVKKYPVIVSSAGMLSGGPAISYLREIRKQPGSKVIFSGFLAEDTPGRGVIDTKIFRDGKEEFKVNCGIEQIELSAHAGKSGLFGIIKKLDPENVICVHGEHCPEFAKEIGRTFGIDSCAPKNGDVVKI